MREERARDENLAKEQQAKADLEAMATETAKRQSILQEVCGAAGCTVESAS